MKQGMEESIEFLQLWTTMGKGGHKETLSGTSAKHPGQEIGEPDAKDTCPIMERADQRRGKSFEKHPGGGSEEASSVRGGGQSTLSDRPPVVILRYGSPR